MGINRIMMKYYWDIKWCLKCIFAGKWTDNHNQANTGSSLIAQVVKNLLEMQETKETQVHFLSWDNPLEEEMATNCSVIDWKIPWTEEPDGLQSMGSQSQTRLSTHTQRNKKKKKERERESFTISLQNEFLVFLLESRICSSYWQIVLIFSK